MDKGCVLIVGGGMGCGMSDDLIRLVAKAETEEVVCLVAKLDDDDTGKVPDWVLLFKAGTVELDGGEQFIVDRDAFDLVSAGIEKYGNELVFDYEHQTLEGVKAPAAGWIKALKYEDTGIWANVEWTEEAAGYIARKEYRYFSPVFDVRKSDRRVVELYSVALTNSPKTRNLQPIAAKLTGRPAKNKGDVMDREKLIAKLGLSANATDAEIQAALDEIVAKAAKGPETVEVVAKGVIEALNLKDGDDVSTVVATIHALNQNSNNTVSKADFDALEKKLLDRDVDEVVAKALTDGKLTPDQKDWAEDYARKDMKGFETFITKAAVVVPVGKLPGKQTEVDAVEADAVTMKIAKSMGLTAEDIKTYGGDE